MPRHCLTVSLEAGKLAHHDRGSGMKYMLAGGSVMAALGLMMDIGGLMPHAAPKKEICQEIVQPKAILSRDQLTQLLSVSEGSDKAQIQQLVKTPYCRLPDIQAQVGAIAQREAYPLAFDPQTWLVILYEGNTYAGYAFSFRH